MDTKKPLFSSSYWHDACAELKNTRMLVIAAFIVVLRVAVKGLKIPIVTGVNLTFDCYVNSVGAVVYGPVMALAVGAAVTVGVALLTASFTVQVVVL